MNANVDGGTHGEACGVDDGHSIVGAIGDDHGRSIGRNPGQAGTSAHRERRRHGAMVEIENRNIVRAGIGYIGASAVGRDVDEEGASVDADGGDDLILLGVNHADVRRAGVDDVDLVALGVGRDSGRVGAHLESSHRPKAAQVDDRNRVALAIRNVGEFAVERAVAGESALVEVVPSGGEDERDKDGK